MHLQEKILIIDFGSQVTQLIARRVRECGVYAEIVSYKISEKALFKFNPKAIILSGGPASVSDNDSPSITKGIFSLNIPILAICYGQQLICSILGGKVEKSNHREFGKAEITICEHSPLFTNFWNKGNNYVVWMSHGDRVIKIPDNFKVIAKTNNAPFAAIADEKKKIYGVQFHPEVTHTPLGIELFRNFIKIAGCTPSWNMGSFLQKKLDEIKQEVGNQKVICGVSGGVDSSVVATLLHKAIGKQLHCVFVNTGLLRKNEANQVKEIFSKLNIPRIYKDASELFLEKLTGISDPESKRKIIGGLFIDVFEGEAKKLGEISLLAQGTLYSDVVESSASIDNPSAKIKSHHNVGGLPARMNMSLIEPLRELFKDEARELGRELGIPNDLIDRHPFPGPGLAVRILSNVTREKIAILQEADDIYIQELKDSGLYKNIWQAFAILLPIKTVGVMGDGRSYEHVCALRAVTSLDGMTADFYPLPYDFLTKVSNKIVNNVKGINRLVYDITSKPPATIEWE